MSQAVDLGLQGLLLGLRSRRPAFQSLLRMGPRACPCLKLLGSSLCALLSLSEPLSQIRGLLHRLTACPILRLLGLCRRAELRLLLSRQRLATLCASPPSLNIVPKLGRLLCLLLSTTRRSLFPSAPLLQRLGFCRLKRLRCRRPLLLSFRRGAPQQVELGLDVFARITRR